MCNTLRILVYVAFKNVVGRVINFTRTLIAGTNFVCSIEFEVSTRDKITIVLSNIFMSNFFSQPVASCAMPVMKGIRVRTDSPFTRKAR